MKKFLVAVAAASALLMSSVAVHAEDQDIAELKCSELMQSGQNIPLFMMWIDGYISAATDNTVMDDAYIEELGTKIGSFCKTNPDATIMDAIQSLGE